jgi:hypothetical protein
LRGRNRLRYQMRDTPQASKAVSAPDDRKTFDARLGDKQTIEGVAVIVRESGENVGVFYTDVELFDAVLRHHGLKELVE